jgi:short-subunit dehydrogenase
MAAELWGHSPAALFGYSHLLGGIPGGQAEYLRVPYADVGPIKVPDGITDEQALFLSDIFPTGYMGADFCEIKGGETIAVFGCGPVAQFSIRSAFLLGAERVIAIDTVPERLRMAEAAGAITIDFMKEDVYDRIQELTHGRGADACIDAVGTEPHTAASFDSMLDRAKVALFMGTDRPHVLRQAIEDAAATLRDSDAQIQAVQADLSGEEGVNTLYAAIGERKVAALLANAGRGLGRGFLDQDPAAWRKVVDTNITGTLLLVQKVAKDMRGAGEGRILITGSIAGFMPGTYQAVYNGSKAFQDSFSIAHRHELKGSGVTVTCLMPGATETDFFETADMMDTKVGTAKKDDPAMVAEKGFSAMMKGEGDVVTGWHNKLQSAIANVLPAGLTAELHRKMAAPGTAS